MIEEVKLINETIIKVEIIGLFDEDDNSEYDDKPILKLIMKSGKVFHIIADYGGYTGKSQDEYPRYIYIKELGSVKE